MAVFKNNYTNQQNLQVNPFLVKIQDDPSVNGIIIIDVDPSYESTTQATIQRNEVWIKVIADYNVTVLSTAPDNINQIGQHSNLDQCLVKVKAGEIFVTKHSTAPQADTNQTNITGYQLGTMDTIYIKLDRRANTVTVFEPLANG